jgi:tetratricopeptide (TPR) repeat protein
VLANLAAILAALGRHTEALPLRQRAVAITEAALGPDHPNTATRLASLAHTFWALGQHTQALPLEQRALAIAEAALGPTTATVRENLAVTLDALGRHTEAVAVREHLPTATPPAHRGPGTSGP